MWLYLTQFLFPEATCLTVPVIKNGLTADQLPIVSAITVEEYPGEILEIIALSSLQGWELRFSRTAGNDLWVCMDQILRSTPMDKALFPR
ncbi:MAG: hypothetical protein JXB07_19940 [Anaerolineae bacterium]|nr:hypothetical protein [Anaerolineae bacterium]